MKTCIDCGKPFLGATRSIRCRSCQLVSNNSSVRKAIDAYHFRNLGEKKRKGVKTYERYGCIQRIGGRFYPRLFADGKLISLGSYDTLEAAADARVEAILSRCPNATIVANHCSICGALLPRRHKLPYCRNCQEKKRASDGYWKRQWAEMTPEQKQHKYAQYRKNYRLRKERSKQLKKPEEE